LGKASESETNFDIGSADLASTVRTSALSGVFLCFDGFGPSKLSGGTSPLFALTTRPFRSLTSALSFKLFSPTTILINPHCDIANNAIVYAHAALQLGNLFARSFNFQQHKTAFGLMKNLVSQLPPAHTLSFSDGAPLLRSNLL